MDEEMTWSRFISTGRVEDYLLYKDAKTAAAQNRSDKTAEDSNEIHNGWPDIKGADN